jgi:hypothetical protein
MGEILISIIGLLSFTGIACVIIDMILNKDKSSTSIDQYLIPSNDKDQNQPDIAEVIIDDQIDSFETMSPESFNF